MVRTPGDAFAISRAASSPFSRGIDVEHRDVRAERAGLLDRVVAVGGLGHDLELLLLQERLQPWRMIW
jgi:hypothetical protein